MPRGEERRSRARVNAESVSRSAKNVRGGSIMRLPGSVNSWHPEKVDTYALRILPYQVTSAHHPDPVKKGQYWYRRPYGIHFDVGGTGTDVCCPKYFGKPCPMCEEADALGKKDYKANKDLIGALRPKQYMAYPAIDCKGDHDEVVIFDWGKGKFANQFDDEIKVADPEVLGFSNADDGRVVKFRVIADSFDGKEYFKTNRVDFVEAKSLASIADEILEKVPALDDCFELLSYSEIEALMHGKTETSDEDADEDEEDDEDEAPKAKAKKPAKDEDDDDDDDDDDEDPKAKLKAKARAKADEDEDEPEQIKAKAKDKGKKDDDDDGW